MLKLNDLTFFYKEKKTLNKVNFLIDKGEICFLLGENGAGKSTLMKCILGILNYKSGNIYIDEKNLKELNVNERSKLIAYVPQEHSSSFNHSVIDMILMGSANRLNFYEAPKTKDIDRAKEILKKLNIEHLENRGYSEISGGERQLVLISRALMQDSKILILDEPHSSLDFGNVIKIMNILKKLKKKGYTILLSSHNPHDIFLYGDKVIVLKNGEVAAIGKPKEVLTSALLSEIYKEKIEVFEIKEKKQILCIPEEV